VKSKKLFFRVVKIKAITLRSGLGLIYYVYIPKTPINVLICMTKGYICELTNA